MTTQSMIEITTPMQGVCQITLNRVEKRNALNAELIAEWHEALNTAATDKKVRLIVFAGNGDHFCAGADLAWMKKIATYSHAENVEDAMKLATLLRAIFICKKPTMALVQGAVMGGALGVLAACDMAFAASDAVFCFSETKIGLTPSVISPYVIPVIGERAAKYYYLTAEKFTAANALELGLVQQVVEKADLMGEGFALAEKILLNSPQALLEAKKLIRHVARHKYSSGLVEFTAEHLAMIRVSADAQEGFEAFLEKRMPVWK